MAVDTIAGGMEVTRVPAAVSAADQRRREVLRAKTLRLLDRTGNLDLVEVLGLDEPADAPDSAPSPDPEPVAADPAEPAISEHPPEPEPATAGDEEPQTARTPQDLHALALDIATRLHDEHSPTIAGQTILAELYALRVADLRHLVLELAALVDVDTPASRLLAWCDGVSPLTRLAEAGALPRDRRPRPPKPARQASGCPSEAQYRRHLSRNEKCPVCRAFMSIVEARRRARHPEWGQR